MDNPVGVLTNNPMFPQQLAVSWWRRARWLSRRLRCGRAARPAHEGPPHVATDSLIAALRMRAAPPLPQYMQAWEHWASGPPNNEPPLTPSLHGSTFYPPPGSFNSSDRFTRLAMLKQAAGEAPWK